MAIKIWSAWLQGRENAPAHVKKIFSLWEELNPNAEFRVLEGDAVDSIISNLRVNSIHMTPQVKTNIARLYLLLNHGGVWVDATLLPTMPLAEWMTPELCKEGFFAFRSTGSPELVLQNWFLYAEKGHKIVDAWLSFYCDYFSVRRFSEQSRRILLTRHVLDVCRFIYAKRRGDPMYFVDPLRGRSCRMYPYAFLNYSLSFILKSDYELATIWYKVPVVFHIMPSLLGYCADDNETPQDTFLHLALDLLPASPVHKLNIRDRRFEALIDKARIRELIK